MADLEMDSEQMTAILDSIEPLLRDAFLKMIQRVRTNLSPDSILRMIAERRYEDASDAFDAAATSFSNDIAKSFAFSAEEAATFLSGALKTIVAFDQFNERAVNLMRQNRLELVKAFTDEQVQVVRDVITNGIARGTNPIAMAREFRDSIGLTPRQAQYVQNYRDALERVHDVQSMGPTEAERTRQSALGRELRDGRSDRSVRNAIADEAPLPSKQIDSMVERYRQNFIAYRAEVIARTEGLRAVHQGVEEMFAQVLDSGDVPSEFVTRIWNTAGDERVRPAHVFMDGQTVGVDEPFVDGDGNELAYPGDPNAPPETTLQCRCVVSTRISVRAITSMATVAGVPDQVPTASPDDGG